MASSMFDTMGDAVELQMKYTITIKTSLDMASLLIMISPMSILRERVNPPPASTAKDPSEEVIDVDDDEDIVEERVIEEVEEGIATAVEAPGEDAAQRSMLTVDR